MTKIQVLILLWGISHAMIFGVVAIQLRTMVLILVGIMIVSAYLLKPYTYDLPKYVVYYETGFLEAFGNPLLANQANQRSGIHMHPKDLTGSPYTAYGAGFNLFIHAIRAMEPNTALLDRFLDRYSLTKRSGVGNKKEIVGMEIAENGEEIDSGPIKPHLTRNALRAEWMLSIITISGILLSTLLVWLFYRNEKQPGQNNVSYLLLCTPVILGSLFFLLGSQNVLRQFFSLLMLLCAIGTFHNGRYFAATLFAISAVSFHYYIVFIGIMWFTKESFCAIAYKFGFRKIHQTMPWPEVFSIAIGSLFTIGIYIIVRFLGDTDIEMIDAVKKYVVDSHKFAAIERSPVWIKALLVGVLLVISEIVAGRKSTSEISRLRVARRSTYCLIIPLSIFPEVFSRFLVFYFAIEMVYVAISIMNNSTRVRLAGCIIFFAYGIAPNALNVLAGPDWGQSVNIKLFS